MSAPNVIQPLRLFIAVPLGGEVKAELQRIQRELQSRSAPDTVRWARPEQMHLTLRFLGDILPDAIPAVEAALRPLGLEFTAFPLRLGSAGCFPDAQSPRVVWIGLGGDLARLDELHKRVQTQTASWGDPPESRDFQPHLTLARIKDPRSRFARQMGERLRTASLARACEWVVDQFLLMQSRLAPQGATHTVLATFVLAGRPTQDGRAG